MHIQFAELPVIDQDRAIKFYVDHLGLTVVSDEPMGTDGWRWVELGLAGAQTNLHFVRRQDEVPSEEPVLVLVDADVRGTIARLKARDVEIVSEPREFRWQPGRLAAEFRDSEGNRMMLGSPAAN
jgi:predicted enzyme related to lactoylglutathione lyase